MIEYTFQFQKVFIFDINKGKIRKSLFLPFPPLIFESNLKSDDAGQTPID